MKSRLIPICERTGKAIIMSGDIQNGSGDLMILRLKMKSYENEWFVVNIWKDHKGYFIHEPSIVDDNVSIETGAKIWEKLFTWIEHIKVELEDYVFCDPSCVFTNDRNCSEPLRISWF